MSQFSKNSITILLGVVLLSTSLQVAQAQQHQPKTLAGALQAARASDKNCPPRLETKTNSTSRGIALLGFDCHYGGSYVQAWAYTGSQWKPLSVGMQESLLYPVTLPTSMYVCRGNEYTNIRSGPSSSSNILGRVTRNTLVVATKVKLETAATSNADGLAWYRITFRNHPAWVSSRRIAAVRDQFGTIGCSRWTSGAVPGY